MFKLNDYYIYGTSYRLGKGIRGSKILEILRDGEIKTRESLGETLDICNADDEICLVDPRVKVSGFNLINSAFFLFAETGPSLVLSRNIPGIYKPEIITNNDALCLQLHATNLLDEVRYKGNISLKHLEFITVPFTTKYKDANPNINKLRALLPIVTGIEEEFHDIEIKDIYTGLPVSSNGIKGKISDQEREKLDHPYSLIKGINNSLL